MADQVDKGVETLRPATNDELTECLAHALRYRGRKRVHDAESDSFMARVAAERLAEQLRASGLVVMKTPPAPSFSTSRHMLRRPPLNA